MIHDTLTFQLINEELERQRNGIELIASEIFTSSDVMKATGSCLTNKYAEGYPSKRYYGGCEVIDKIEQLAIDRLKELFGVEYANVQPHSGAQANAAVFLACLKPGDPTLGFSLAHGGHLSHGHAANFSGKHFSPHFYGVEPETGRIDMDKVEEKALEVKPKMIICGASAYAREWDYARFRAIADKVGALLLADIAHPAGLIAAGLLNSPVDYAHIVTSTTHKTLRGPRGGIIMLGKNFENPFGKTTAKGTLIKMSTIIDSGIFPGMQGGPLEHVIAAKAIAFHECLQPEFKIYARQVIANAQAMAKAFVSKGYNLISGGTDNHLMLIDLSNKNVSGRDAEVTLGKIDITVNKNMVPFDTKSAVVTSGIRIGTPAITTRGFFEKDCVQVVNWIDAAIINFNDEEILKNIKHEINAFMQHYPLYADSKELVESH